MSFDWGKVAKLQARIHVELFKNRSAAKSEPEWKSKILGKLIEDTIRISETLADQTCKDKELAEAYKRLLDNVSGLKKIHEKRRQLPIKVTARSFAINFELKRRLGLKE